MLSERADLSICCDGAAEEAYRYGLPFQTLVGDMDSIRPDLLEVTKIHTRAGNHQLSVEKRTGRIRNTPFRMPWIAGVRILPSAEGWGKRMDHSLGQLQILYGLCKRGIPHTLYSKICLPV